MCTNCVALQYLWAIGTMAWRPGEGRTRKLPLGVHWTCASCIAHKKIQKSITLLHFVQEAGEEIARHSSDDQINGKIAIVLRGSDEVPARWAHVQVGDVIKVSP